ncbi:hypothetical protein Aperf_G00000027440 [Anoplocephala perfoliata]
MAQEEELSSLELFCEPESFHYSKDQKTSLFTGWYRADPKLPLDCPSIHVRLRVSSQTKTLHPFDMPQFVVQKNTFCKYYSIGYLPPVVINFTLPVDYPNDANPIFSLECTWILSDRLQAIEERLMANLATKEKGEPCLWECFDFLEWQLIPELLGLPKEEDGSYLYDLESSIPTRVMREYALEVLVENDAEKKRKQFREGKVECEVCWEERLGQECTRLIGCGHVACHECMRAALEAHMAEGIMAGVFRCMHCDGVVDLPEIKEFATAEQFRTYDNFLLQRSLSLMNDVVRCPRSKCDSTCLVDNESLARCPKCHYTFCPQCLRLSHPGQSCPPPPEIPKVKKKPKRKPMKNNEEGGDDNEDEEDEEVNFVRYEEKEIPTLGNGLEESLLVWKLAHEGEKSKRRELIERIISKRLSTTSETIVGRRFKDMNFNRCPNCGLFVNKISGCNNVWCPVCQKNFIFGS